MFLLRPSMRTAFLSSLLIVIAAGLMAAGPTPARVPAPDGSIQVTDSSSVVSTVRAFHTALQEGDTASVRELLASDARVAESGGLETREEYLSHHLPGDMAYAAAVNRELGLIDVTVAGDVAWTVSTSRTTGTFRDRPVNSAGAELMVLSRDSERWRIRAIHWSSRQAR